MAYNRDIPQPNDFISNSQGQILANFQAIDSGTTGTGIGFSRNHVTMTDGTFGGRHYIVDFLSDLPDPIISGFTSSVYSKSVSAASELAFSNATGVFTQITSGALPIWKGGTVGTNGVATLTSAISGAMNLPNGLQMRWGNATVNTAGTAITFSSPFTSLIYSLTISPVSNVSRGVAYNSANAAGFTAYSENNGTTCTYIAIGA